MTPIALSNKCLNIFTFQHSWFQKLIKKTLRNYPSVATEALKIYLILIVNDVCLFYVSYAQQLQLSRLIFESEKKAVFVPKSGKIVVKINGVTS